MKTQKYLKHILITIGCLFLLFSAFVVIKAMELRNHVLDNKQLVEQEEKTLLQDISLRIGNQFDDWLSLREYIYCGSFLKKGMSWEQMEEALSLIGKFETNREHVDIALNEINDTSSKRVYIISFIDRHLYYNLSPFAFSYIDGKLDSWRRDNGDIINMGAPIASCETQ